MNIDGVFLHYLIEEIKPSALKTRISKLVIVNGSEFAFLLQNKNYLYVSLNSNSPHIRLTSNELIKSTKNNPFFTQLRKYAEGSIISNIHQQENDRSLVIDLNSFDELGYITKIKFIIELYGRNSNFIITNDDNEIIECYKRLLPNEDELRVLIPKAKYEFASNLVNPFKLDKYNGEALEGVSTILLNEINYYNDINVIRRDIAPSLIEKDSKYYFYLFPLSSLKGNVTSFNSLSKLLEYYFYEIKKDTKLNDEQNLIRQHLLKMIKKSEVKLEKQRNEKTQAIDALINEKIGNLLSSNLHLIKKNSTCVKVNDFFSNNEEIEISLDPKLSPSENLNHYYQKYKKAKRTLDVIDDQIAQTINEINYYNQILDQIEINRSADLTEIIGELNLKKEKKKVKAQTPNITIYKDNKGNMIYVGKNNIQNNYLTHTFAHSNDYFLHVTGYSGSHTILRCGELTAELLNLAAMVALLYSKNKETKNASVDYTLVRYVKKVPKTFGSFVTYTNQKTVYATVDMDKINKELTRIK